MPVAASDAYTAELLRPKPKLSVEDLGPKVHVYFKESVHAGFVHSARLVTIGGLREILDEVRLVIRLFEPEF